MGYGQWIEIVSKLITNKILKIKKQKGQRITIGQYIKN